MVKYFCCHRALIQESLRKLRTHWNRSIAPSHYRLHYCNDTHYQLVNTLECTTREPLSHEFSLQNRRQNDGRVMRRYWTDVGLQVRQTSTTCWHNPLTTKNRPISENAYNCHLDTCLASLSFDVKKLDRTWSLRAPHVDGNDVLTFSPVTNRIHPVYMKLKSMWIRVRVTLGTRNSRTSMSYSPTNRRSQKPTPASCSIVSLWIARSLCYIWPYRDLMACLSKTMHSNRSTSKISAIKARSRLKSSLLDGFTNKREKTTSPLDPSISLK